MNSRKMSEDIWPPAAYNSSEFADAMAADSPWGNSALNDFTNLGDYGDSPAALSMRTPSKSGPDAALTAAAQASSRASAAAPSAESSSQDSSSDTSSMRKRKTTSESPISDPLPEMRMRNPVVKQESALDTQGYQNIGGLQRAYGQPLPNLAVDQAMSDNNDEMFNFNSAASSPNLPRDFNQQLSLDAKMNIPASRGPAQFVQDSPVQTINPGMFTLGGSRDPSPATNNLMFNTASPGAIFSTPSSDSNDTFNANSAWNNNFGPNPTWPADFSNQFASPAALGFTPSPVAANGGTPSMAPRKTGIPAGRSPLHIAPISTKSRVETQINVVMTLEKPPPGVENVHLPLHTIAKSKLLAKEDYDQSKVLELHTMLVCSSAMHNPVFKERALQRAATQVNAEIQLRAEQQRELSEDEKNDMRNVDEHDRPASGGEVKICSNCIQRERKRAGRKKLKREEEQQHWERYETERVVVFNSNEYLPLKPFDQAQQPQKDGAKGGDEPYNAPEGALSVQAAMRIACYCRHQSEKEGFRVIFTLKDQQGNVVAQEMSDSILITDDHKTHPPTLTSMPTEMIYQAQQYPQNGLQTSYSMVDLPSHVQPFTSSRSAGNLQALAYGHQQFQPHSHIHQLPAGGFNSQATSATMTPTSLSRPGSPTFAGQAGPNKKRKSSSFHKRVPSGLQMTPRVDTNHSPSSNMPSGVPMSANFSPSAFAQQNDPSFMTVPHQHSTQYLGSGPSTPANESAPFAFGHPHQLDIARAQNSSAYFSHPSSTVVSRSNSPVLPATRPNMAAFARQPIQTPTNQMPRGGQMFAAQTAPGSAGAEMDPSAAPTITKITPIDGPISGGTEVSIFGYNFTHGTQVLFGETPASTTFYGTQSLLAVSPPGRKGAVRVKLVNSPATVSYSSPHNNNSVFTYTDVNPQMMEMALRFLSQKQTGDAKLWMQYTNEVANQFMQTSISQGGIQGQGYGGNMMSTESAGLEEMQHSSGSQAPRNSSWEISSISTVGSDVDSSEYGLSMEPSRRPSIGDSLPSADEPSVERKQSTSSLTVLAWRDALAAQLGKFEQGMRDSMSSFELPTPPPLPTYQECIMTRRLTSLVAHAQSARTSDSEPKTSLPKNAQLNLRDLMSAPLRSASPPPSYSELFPNNSPTEDGHSVKSDGVPYAMLDAVADEKCAMLFENSLASCPSSAVSLGCTTAPGTQHTATNQWLWRTFLLLLTSIVIHAATSWLCATVTWSLDALVDASSDLALCTT